MTRGKATSIHSTSAKSVAAVTALNLSVAALNTDFGVFQGEETTRIAAEAAAAAAQAAAAAAAAAALRVKEAADAQTAKAVAAARAAKTAAPAPEIARPGATQVVAPRTPHTR